MKTLTKRDEVSQGIVEMIVKEDAKVQFRAAAKAQEACDFIMGHAFDGGETGGP